MIVSSSPEATMHLLLVEDDPDLGAAVHQSLRTHGFTARWVRTAGDALTAVSSGGFDAMVLDLSLPDGDGLSVIRDLRARALSLPIIVITARLSLDDRLVGLDGGADDYIVKPFDARELVSRLHAVIRRGAQQTSSVWTRGALQIDSLQRTVTLHGDPVHLTPKEFQLLFTLARHVGKVVPKHKIAHELSPFGTPLDFNALEVHVHGLRRKLGNDRIGTVRGVGYLLEP
jgi:two-component system response regulator QseB